MEYLCATCYIVLFGIVYAAYKIIPKILLQKKLDRFDKSKCPKDVVILHGVRRSKTIPSFSPFVLKLETFIRMANISYEYDGNPINTFGPKGKTPWISLNGEHIADSELCIAFLSKKFEKSIKNNYSKKELAIANTVRIVLEDRMFWELVMWCFVWDGEGPKAVRKLSGVPWIIFKYLQNIYKKSTWAQGIGRHAKQDIEAWSFQNIRSISHILGNNKFLLGDEPCTEDAALFGFAAQFLWGYPSNTHYSKLIDDELPNIKEYCNRMKERYYPDWDQCLFVKKSQ